MKNKIVGIYCIENLVNNKKYIGKSKRLEKREKEHFKKLKRKNHENYYLQKSWDKYGEENFSFYIVEECSKEELNDREKYYIREWNTKIPKGYNLTDGGDGFINPSKSIRLNMSKNHANVSGKNNPQYGKIGVLNSKFGRHHSEETKKKMSRNNSRYNFGKKSLEATSVYYGVCKVKNNWKVQIKIKEKLVYIGQFKNEMIAAQAYDKFVIENNLPNPLNFPDEHS